MPGDINNVNVAVFLTTTVTRGIDTKQHDDRHGR